MPDLLQRLQEALKDRYQFERTLGHGGTATVFLAKDLKHGRLVAVKVLNPEVGAAIGVERFLGEIQTISPMIHPNILPLHDSGQADGLVFFVMPYVEGKSLRDRLRRGGSETAHDAAGRACAAQAARRHQAAIAGTGVMVLRRSRAASRRLIPRAHPGSAGTAGR